MADLPNRRQHESDMATAVAKVLQRYRDEWQRGQAAPKTERSLKEELLALLALLFSLGSTTAAGELGIAVLSKGQANAWAESYSGYLARRIVDGIGRRLGKARVTDLTGELGLVDQMANRIASPENWAGFSATEVTRANTAGGEFTAVIYNTTQGVPQPIVTPTGEPIQQPTQPPAGVEPPKIPEPAQAYWYTAKDDRVCFPAGTMIATQDGSTPIESVSVGDYVHTRAGLRRVIARSRKRYAGQMTKIVAGEHSVTATSDHPVWTLEQGWLACGSLTNRHTLESLSNKPLKVASVVNFSLGKPNHEQTTFRKRDILATVAAWVTVPVFSINFNRNRLVDQQEVNGIAPDSSLLLEVESERFENYPDGRFDGGLSGTSSVASEAAKLPVMVSGLLPEFSAARFARYDNRRTPAFFRAKPTSARAGYSLFATESFSASLAVDVDNFGLLASDAAYLESMGYGLLDGKCSLANAAFFGDVLRCLQKTGTAAVCFVSAIRNQVELLLARWANLIYATAFSLCRNMLHSCVRDGHWIYVYDLQVEEVPEFYANGILVHNCPICKPLDGRPRDEWQVRFPMGPPAHDVCRCWIDYAVAE